MQPHLKAIPGSLNLEPTGSWPELCSLLTENVARVFLGKDKVIRDAILALLAGGHILLEDVPGVGKTLLAKAIAKTLSADFKRIQFTADLLPSDVTGVSIFSQETNEFYFRRGPVFTNVLLADEINRATPRTQSSLLEAMEEQHVTVDGIRHPLPSPFFVIATQNPVELEGTYPLPFAQMDRFICRLSIGYLEKEAEIAMLKLQRTENPLEKIQPVMNIETLLEIQKAVQEVTVADTLADFIVSIIRATRSHEAFEYGASPRGTLDLQAFSQATALMDGRDYVLPDDIKRAAAVVLPHRLISRKSLRNTSPGVNTLIHHIIQSVPVPL